MQTSLFNVLALTSLLAACGGGGSSDTNEPLLPAGTQAIHAPSEQSQGSSQAGGPPASVQARVNTLKSSGVQILRVYSAPYVDAPAATNPAPLQYGPPVQPATDVELRAYPSGCGLWVIVYRSGNIIYNASTTSCLGRADRIEMLAGLAWSRWWGWDEVYQDEDGVSRRDHLDLTIWADCSGTGTHDYQGVTNGYVEIAGRGYHASAWDQIDRIECG